MEKKIKTLYILSIIAIVAFLVMQVYWLYGRFEYSLRDYEDRAELSVADALAEYDKVRARGSSTLGDTVRVQSAYNMNYDKDSVGGRIRRVDVTTKVIRGRELLGIKENRKLTPEEMDRLQKVVIDSIDDVETKRATLDVTGAPSDGAAWTSMYKFELEVQSPFTVEGLDSILRKADIEADISLILTDSLTWEPTLVRHSSVISPKFKVITHYSELEHKAVVIDCMIPTSEILREMLWTLIMAVVLSLALILCLLWQIKTIVRLTRLDRMRNSFVTTMIHELKRPISTLKMCVSGIDNEKLMDDAQLRHELTGEMRVALDNLSAYFSRLRDITFNDVEQIPLNLSSFNLRELVDGAVSSVAIPGAKHVVFENDVADDVAVSADRTHLTNIITNLMENAVKYSGDEVTVRISARQSADGLYISIDDNGDGIAPADRQRIFNRFYRGNASATDIPGMGLGLTYVKLLVDAHGGEISVESEEGVGSTFTIKLP